MKKIVVKLDYHDDKGKQKAMKAVSSMTGIGSISIDAKEKKLTVVGEVDAVDVIKKLRKVCHAQIVSVGPPEEKKKEEPKKEEKKEEPKKEEKKEDPKKAEEDMKKQVAELVNAYKAYNPHYTTHYIVHSAEENPNSCVIS